jgi:branched-chain amino acid transport system ATP-binding protein
MTTPLLDVRGLHKRFGGVVASDGVDLQLRGGEIHALIGPNGAGKTSLVAQLAGQLASDSGQVVFDGADITRLVAHQRARRGLVRSFQITRLLKSLSVQGNLAFAVQATQDRVFAAWRPVRDEQTLFERARELLARLGLAHKADARIDQLSHGEQRALEVGMTLASRPRLVLLDEPLAGMGAQESQSMARLIESLRQDCAVLLIEHDVSAVFRLADRVSVLVSGRIIASGTPEAVRNHAGAIAAYLGDAQDAT